MAASGPSIAFERPPTGGRSSDYLDRDLSDLAYVRRILEHAEDPATPLAERVRFLGISTAVMDEFIAVRLHRVDSMARDSVLRGIDSLRASQRSCLRVLLQAVECHGVAIDLPDFDHRDLQGMEQQFDESVLPALTPLMVDREHPFPFIHHRQLGLVFEVGQAGGSTGMVVLPVPQGVPAFLASPDGSRRLLPTETVTAALGDRFLGSHQIIGVGLFRPIRINDLPIADDFVDLRDEVERTLEIRERNPVISLEISTNTPPHLVQFLESALLTEGNGFVWRSDWPGVARFDALQRLVDEALRRSRVPGAFYPANAVTRPPALIRHDGDLFAALREQDLILHWPYDDFEAQLHFLHRAAEDPDVVAIKQTLYRSDPEVIRPLMSAARNGKDVTVVLELEAREDERHNVELSRALEAEGARVLYGIIGLKVHAKLLLVVRREAGRLREYANFSTGNYHPGNARHYSDLSLFTADPEMGRDLTHVFNYVTGHLPEPGTRRLVVAPHGMREFLIDAINQEAANAQAGKGAGIWLKLNSLLDQRVIDALYAASQAGVSIRAVIRRHCALRPGVSGLSPGIEVKSIVGRYLEHARLVCFGNGNTLPSSDSAVWLSSADWMPRNFDDRVEVLVPVRSASVRSMLLNHVMAADLGDTEQSWTLQPDGQYERTLKDGFCAQSYFATTRYPT